MHKFPTLWLILDASTFAVWRAGKALGTTVATAAKSINVKIFGKNILAPLQAIVKVFGALLKAAGSIGLVAFIVCMAITIFFLARMIFSKLKYKKMMKKVNSMPDPEAMQATAAAHSHSGGVEVESDGMHSIDSFSR